jgi:hypothetical protein
MTQLKRKGMPNLPKNTKFVSSRLGRRGGGSRVSRVGMIITEI